MLMPNKEPQKFYDPKTGNLIKKYCQNPACPKFYDEAEAQDADYCPYCGESYLSEDDDKNISKYPLCRFFVGLLSFIIAVLLFCYTKSPSHFKAFKTLILSLFTPRIIVSLILATIIFFISFLLVICFVHFTYIEKWWK